MAQFTMIGIDLAKTVFHLCGVRTDGSIVFERSMRRGKLLAYLSSLEPCVIALESCGTSNYWGRFAQQSGHRVKMIHPIRVAAFLGAQKNDRRDARAICEAARQPGTNLIGVKSEASQELQSLVRIRDGLMKQRTQTINSTRAHLAEFGYVYPKGAEGFCNRLRDRLTAAELPGGLRRALEGCADRLDLLNQQVKALEKEITTLGRSDEQVRRLKTIPGVGPLTAAALTGAVADPQVFASARHFSAWLGLVPRQYSTGGKTRLKGITKRGDSLIRKMLVQGVNAVIRTVSPDKPARNALEAWIQRRKPTLPHRTLVVAVANRMARIIWAVLAYQTQFDPKR